MQVKFVLHISVHETSFAAESISDQKNLDGNCFFNAVVLSPEINVECPLDLKDQMAENSLAAMRQSIFITKCFRVKSHMRRLPRALADEENIKAPRQHSSFDFSTK